MEEFQAGWRATERRAGLGVEIDGKQGGNVGLAKRRTRGTYRDITWERGDATRERERDMGRKAVMDLRQIPFCEMFSSMMAATADDPQCPTEGTRFLVGTHKANADANDHSGEDTPSE